MYTLYPSLALVQPRKTRPVELKKIVDWDVKNQISNKSDKPA